MLATESILHAALQVSLLLIVSVSVIDFFFNNPVFVGIFALPLSHRDEEIPGHHGHKDTRQTVGTAHDLLHPTCWTGVTSTRRSSVAVRWKGLPSNFLFGRYFYPWGVHWFHRLRVLLPCRLLG